MTDRGSAYGIPVDALPQGWQPLEVAVIVKCLDDQGRLRLSTAYSDGLNAWEAIGMLDLEHAAERARVVALFNHPDELEDET